MAYNDNFKHADDVIAELNNYVPTIKDPLIQSKYVGFVSVVAVTVYEMAIKEIFITFANNKDEVFGNFIESFFYRINGQIKVKCIEDKYLSKFGKKYVDGFDEKLEIKANQYMITNKRNFKSQYNNLIVWRNAFAHEGKINQNATFSEVVQAYDDGKEVINCLAESMKR